MDSSQAGNHPERGVASANGERVSRTEIKPRTGFRAELPGLDIATLLQTTCARGERLVVRVASHSDEGYLYSADGRIVHATLGALVGEDAVLGMVAWTGGEFAIVDRPFPQHPSIECSIEALLLRAAQSGDEALRGSEATRVSIEPAAPVPASAVPLPPPATRASSMVATARGNPPPATAPSCAPAVPARAAEGPHRVSARAAEGPHRPEGRVSTPPPMPPSAYVAIPPASVARDSVLPTARDVSSLARPRARFDMAHDGIRPTPRDTIQSALRESYDEENDAPTLQPPAPRSESARSVAPRGQAASSDAPPRQSKLPPPLPWTPRKPALRSEPVDDSAVVASVRVNARGEVVGTFAGDGTGDLLPQLVAYVTRLIALVRGDFSLDPFEALHAELSGMRILLFEDAGETVGMMMRPGRAVQELRQRLGV